MKEVPIIDVFDTTDFNPELILSSVFLDPGLDFVTNIEELGENIMSTDLLQQLGNPVFYPEDLSIPNSNNIDNVTNDECHLQLLQKQTHHPHLQQQQTTTLTTSKAHVKIKKNTEGTHFESLGSDYTKQLLSSAPLTMMVQTTQQQVLQQQPCRCEFCEYLQANRISLTGDHSFQCEFCGEGFSNQASFNRHRCGSTDIQLYRCENCRQEYGSSRVMSSLGNSEQQDKCDLCNRSYEQSRVEGQAVFPSSQVSLNVAPTTNFTGSSEVNTNITRFSGTFPLPTMIDESFGTTPLSLTCSLSPEASNRNSNDLSAVNVQSNVARSTELHDRGIIDNLGPSEDIKDVYAADVTNAPEASSSSTLTLINNSNSSVNFDAASTTPHTEIVEPIKTYFLLGNVQQLQHGQQNQTCSNSNISNVQSATNSLYHLQIPSALGISHQQQTPTSLQQGSSSAAHMAGEHQVTSLHQYDDEDSSSMSEDEAIVPIEPYAKWPNQEHAKTELPVQETIVDTSTKETQFFGGRGDRLSSANITSTSRPLANVTEQEYQDKNPCHEQHQRALLLQQFNAPFSLASILDDEDGRCDSSSSLGAIGLGNGGAQQQIGSPTGIVLKSAIERSHKCHICERSYRNQKNLKSHLKVHEGIRAFQCEICGKNFSGSSYLVIHRRRHTGERPFKCITCGKAFVDSRALAVHTRLHSGERLKCEKCEKTFSSVSALTVHNRLHTGIHPYKCEQCSKTFPQYNNLKHHMKKHEIAVTLAEKQPVKNDYNAVRPATPNSVVAMSCFPVISKHMSQHCTLLEQMAASSSTDFVKTKCHICSKVYKTSTDLQEHLFQHSKDRPNQCEFCSKVFPRSSHLIIHRRRHTGERPFKCKYCDKAFVDSRALSVHTRLHTGERVKCEICEKTFASSSGLIVHRRIHTGIHPYKCDYCEKSFAQSTALKYHLKKHDKVLLPTTSSNASGVLIKKGIQLNGKPAVAYQTVPVSTSSTLDRYKCPVCNKLFRSSEYLVRHRRTHSGERPYQCEICGKKFSTMSYLVIHRRRHTSERPYKCSSCEKAFVDSRALQEHARLHTGDRVRCEICQKTYSSISNLIVHRRIHSGIHPFECNNCGKSFAQKNALKYHLKKHMKQE